MKEISEVNGRHAVSGGFSLIEVMIAMALFSIGLLAVASMQGTNVRNNTTGNITTQASMLARARLEQLKSMDITALVPGDYADPTNIDADGNPGGIYQRQWRIQSMSPDLRSVEVTVGWDRLGQRRSVTLTTVTRGGGV